MRQKWLYNMFETSLLIVQARRRGQNTRADSLELRARASRGSWRQPSNSIISYYRVGSQRWFCWSFLHWSCWSGTTVPVHMQSLSWKDLMLTSTYQTLFVKPVHPRNQSSTGGVQYWFRIYHGITWGAPLPGRLNLFLQYLLVRFCDGWRAMHRHNTKKRSTSRRSALPKRSRQVQQKAVSTNQSSLGETINACDGCKTAGRRYLWIPCLGALFKVTPAATARDVWESIIL